MNQHLTIHFMKNTYKGFVLFLLFSIYGLQAISQEEVFTKFSDDFYPKSPKAEGLIKYSDFPVDHGSGTLNISIPIHTIRSGDFALPISLNYHTGGIGLSQMASNIGLGWTLSAGGLITRSVKGSAPDEGGNSGTVPTENNWGYLTNNADVIGFKQILLDHSVQCGFPGSGEEAGEQIGYFWDMEPDIFQFTAPGLSGSFTHDYNGNPLLIKEQDLLVENISTSGIFNEWMITKPDGTKYIFGTKEKSKIRIRNSVGVPFSGSSETSAWLLDRIITSQNDTINFYYSDSYYTIGDIIYGSESIYFENEIVQAGSIGTKIEKTQSIRQLERIESKNESIVFQYGINDREDLNGTAKPLEYIRIYEKQTSGLVSKFHLITSYFDSNVTTGYEDVPDYSFKRLRLDQIVLFGGETYKLGEYEFKYNKYNNVYNNHFPPRLSRAVDHWGYYNGHNENTRLIPNSVNYRLSGNVLVAGADRSSSSLYKKAFILDEVKYPTGGVAKFYFDSDEAYYNELNTSTLQYVSAKKPAGGLLINRSVYDPGDGVPIITDYGYDTGQFLYGGPEYQVIGFCDNVDYDVDNVNTCVKPSGAVYSNAMNLQWAGVANKVMHTFCSVSNPGNGRVEYRFILPSEDFPKYVVKPVLNDGQVSQVDYYNESNELVKRVTNHYNSYYRKLIDENDLLVGHFETVSCQRMFTSYSIYSGYSFLSQKIEEVYDNENKLETNIDYTYGTLNYSYNDEDEPHIIITGGSYPIHHQMTSQETAGSQNEHVKTEIKYVADFITSAKSAEIGQMQNLFLKTKPVEIKKMVNRGGVDYVTNAQYLNYRNFEGYYGIGEVYNFKSVNPVNKSVFSFGSYSGGNYYPSGYMEESFQYTFNGLGRLIEQQKTNNLPVSFIYHPGYNDPAHVLVNADQQNVSYTSFEYPQTSGSFLTEDGWVFPNQLTDAQSKTGYWSLLNGTLTTTGYDVSKSYKVSFWAKKSGSSSSSVKVGSTTVSISSTSWTYYEVPLSSLGTSLSVLVTNAYLDELMMYPTETQLSSFSFTPIGITSQIDPNSRTTYYEYEYGRLKLIKDYNKDVLKGYRYKYSSGN